MEDYDKATRTTREKDGSRRGERGAGRLVRRAYGARNRAFRGHITDCAMSRGLARAASQPERRDLSAGRPVSQPESLELGHSLAGRKLTNHRPGRAPQQEWVICPRNGSYTRIVFAPGCQCFWTGLPASNCFSIDRPYGS